MNFSPSCRCRKKQTVSNRIFCYTRTDFYGSYSPQQVTFDGQTRYSIPNLDTEQTGAEWKIFRHILFTNFSSFLIIMSRINLLSTTSHYSNCFSDIKLIKTRLRSRLSEDTLDQAMRVCIEGPEKLSDEELDLIVNHWKEQKP